MRLKCNICKNKDVEVERKCRICGNIKAFEEIETSPIVEVKVWCETCEGIGTIWGKKICPDCDDQGYTLKKYREVEDE